MSFNCLCSVRGVWVKRRFIPSADSKSVSPDFSDLFYNELSGRTA